MAEILAATADKTGVGRRQPGNVLVEQGVAPAQHRLLDGPRGADAGAQGNAEVGVELGVGVRQLRRQDNGLRRRVRIEPRDLRRAGERRGAAGGLVAPDGVQVKDGLEVVFGRGIGRRPAHYRQVPAENIVEAKVRQLRAAVRQEDGIQLELVAVLFGEHLLPLGSTHKQTTRS